MAVHCGRVGVVARIEYFQCIEYPGFIFPANHIKLAVNNGASHRSPMGERTVVGGANQLFAAGSYTSRVLRYVLGLRYPTPIYSPPIV